MEELATPQVGDKIYAPTSMYIDHGEDDVLGGLATVTNVRLSQSAGQETPFVSVKEHPGHSYNWKLLSQRQEELRTQFGDRVAREDPDFGPRGL